MFDSNLMNSKKFKICFWVIVGLILAAVVMKVWWANFPWVSSSKWQAVFLSNGQVYFGHIKPLWNREYVSLTNIYYLQVLQPLQQGQTGAAPNINLVKLGGELHGPEDVMYIPRDKILFWENMKADARVVRAIEQSLPKK